jgi:hypothetical protein
MPYDLFRDQINFELATVLDTWNDCILVVSGHLTTFITTRQQSKTQKIIHATNVIRI